MVEIKIEGKVNKPTILEGFSGVGLIGALTTNHIIRKKDLEQIGHISARGLPPIAIMEEGVIKEPIRIFANKKRDLIVITSSFQIPSDIAYDIAEEITNWAREVNSKRIYCLEGMGASKIPNKPKTYLVSSKKSSEEELENKVESLKKGIMMGTSALVLLKSKEKDLDTVCLMTQSNSQLPDGKAAAEQIRKLNGILNLDIDPSELEEKSEEFEEKIKKLLKRAKKAKDAVEKPEGLMYG